MRSFQGYFTKAKDTVTSAAKYTWSTCFVQEVVEGLVAPIYGYASLCNALTQSEDLQDALQEAEWLNFKYALEGFIVRMYYDRVVHADLSAFAAAHDYRIISYGTSALDYITFDAMHLILIRELCRNLVQNYGFTNTITYSAAKIMPQSLYFQPADSKAEQLLSTMGSSTLVCTVNRYFTEMAAEIIKLCLPGVMGYASSFLLKSLVYGWLLINFKLSAAGLSNEGFIKKWQDNIPYIISYGASLVAATLITYYSGAFIFGGAYNYYSYDAILSIMFDFFAIMSISRTNAYAGDNQEGMDIWALIKPYVDTPFVRKCLRLFLAELYSWEELVKSKGVSQALAVREEDIKNGLNSIKDGIKTVEDIQNSKMMMFAQCISYLGIIPNDAITMLNNIGKDYLSYMIERVEGLLDIAKTAEAERNVIKPNYLDSKLQSKEVIDTKERPEEKKSNPLPVREVIVYPPPKIDMTNIPKIIPKKLEPKPSDSLLEMNVPVTKKPEDPKPINQEKEDEKKPISLKEPIIEENYFGNAPKPLIQINNDVTKRKTNVSLADSNVRLFSWPLNDATQSKSGDQVTAAASIISSYKG